MGLPLLAKVGEERELTEEISILIFWTFWTSQNLEKTLPT